MITPDKLTELAINRLASEREPLQMRRDATIALNLNGNYSAVRVRNACQRICNALNARAGKSGGDQ